LTEAPVKRAPQSVSYGFGVDVARNLNLHRLRVDADLLVRGLRDALSNEKPPLPKKTFVPLWPPFR